MPNRLQTLTRPNPGPLVRSALFFSAFYLYVYLQIDPRLLYQAQEPVFFRGWPFCRGFLVYPGGLAEYLSALLSQLYYYPWAGSLILTAIAGLVCLGSRMFTEVAGGVRSQFLHFVPAIILLVLHNRYLYPLGPDLGVLIALSLSLLYARLPLRHALLRLLSFLALSLSLFWGAASAHWLFAALCGTAEALGKRRLLLGLALLASALAVPHAAAQLFVVTVADAYGRSLPFHRDSQMLAASLGLYLSFFPAAAGTVFGRRSGVEKLVAHATSPAALKFLEYLRRGKLRWSLSTLALLAVAAVAASSTFDPNYKALYQIDYYASQRDWRQVLERARHLRAYNTLVVYHINRALGHTGRLADEMFSYPQMKSAAIFLPTPEEPANLKALSAILLELGQVNSAEHLAHEALEVFGDCPSLLQRLVLINVLKGRVEAARTFLGLLDKTLLYREWARHCREALEADPHLETDEELRQIRSLMITEEHAGYFTPEALLEQSLEKNSQNRLAFEYLLGHYLLSGQLDKIADSAGRLSAFPDLFRYPEIPRHCEEAMLLYMAGKRVEPGAGSRPSLHGWRIRPQTLQRFRDFNAVLARHKDDLGAARQALASAYGNTYWFYYLFRRSPAEQQAREVTRATRPQAQI